MSKNDFWTFPIDLRHDFFFGPKKNVSILFGRFHHLAWFFYGLNLRDLPQAFRIWCEIGISEGIPWLDCPRSKKTGKIRKQCYQTLFSVWRLSTKQITANYILTKFRDIPSAKSRILANFSIFGHHHWNWTKGSKMAVLASFWAKKNLWMGFLYWIMNY